MSVQIYSDETLDRIIAETPGGLAAGATAITNLLRGALFTRIRIRKAELAAERDNAKQDTTNNITSVFIDGVEVRGVVQKDAKPISGLVRKK